VDHIPSFLCPCLIACWVISLVSKFQMHFESQEAWTVSFVFQVIYEDIYWALSSKLAVLARAVESYLP